jgi:hypothetical protein
MTRQKNAKLDNVSQKNRNHVSINELPFKIEIDKELAKILAIKKENYKTLFIQRME